MNRANIGNPWIVLTFLLALLIPWSGKAFACSIAGQGSSVLISDVPVPFNQGHLCWEHEGQWKCHEVQLDEAGAADYISVLPIEGLVSFEADNPAVLRTGVPGIVCGAVLTRPQFNPLLPNILSSVAAIISGALVAFLSFYLQQKSASRKLVAEWKVDYLRRLARYELDGNEDPYPSPVPDTLSGFGGRMQRLIPRIFTIIEAAGPPQTAMAEKRRSIVRDIRNLVEADDPVERKIRLSTLFDRIPK